MVWLAVFTAEAASVPRLIALVLMENDIIVKSQHVSLPELLFDVYAASMSGAWPHAFESFISALRTPLVPATLMFHCVPPVELRRATRELVACPLNEMFCNAYVPPARKRNFTFAVVAVKVPAAVVLAEKMTEGLVSGFEPELLAMVRLLNEEASVMVALNVC